MLQDEIDRYLLSLITTHSPQTVSWYRKRTESGGDIARGNVLGESIMSNQDIKVNSNWRGKSTGRVINVDSVDNQFVRFHTVRHKDGSAPEPNEWKQSAMPPRVFLQNYEHLID